MGGGADGLIGRHAELARVDRLLTGAYAGAGGALALIGDAGAGKSSLARVAASSAARLDMTVRFGRCPQLTLEQPFAGLFDALGTRSRDILGSDPTYDRTVLEAGAMAATGFLLGERLSDRIETHAHEQPLLLVVEDLHWSDTATLQLLRALVERAGDLALAILVTTRVPRPVGEVQRLLDAAPALDRLELPPLPSSDVRSLVTQRVGLVPGERLSSALDRAGGNPLLVIAALEALESAGALERSGEVIELTGAVPELQPGTTITSRLAELGDEVLRVLQPAAVLGANIEPSMLADVTGRRVAELAPALDAASEAGVLVVDDDCYAFRHELHRAAVLSTMPRALRDALHLDAARALITRGAPAIEVAEHFAQGARPGNREAVVWLERAANEMVDHAPAIALELLDVALRLCGSAPPRDLLLARVRALAGTGKTAETEALAQSLLREGIDSATEAQLHRELAFTYFVQGRMQESVIAIERYGELIEDRRIRCRVQAEIAFGRFVALDHAGARVAAEAALDEGLRLGDLPAQVGGGGVLCWLDEFSNHFDRALARADEITALAAQPHAVEASIYQPWFAAALVHLEADRFADLQEDVRRGRASGERTGFSWSLPGYDAMSAYGLLRTGDHDDAIAVATATLGYLDGVDGFGVALWCHAFLAQIAIHRGHDDVAVEHLAIAEGHLTTGRAQFGFEQTMIARARLAERNADLTGALQMYSDTWDAYGAIGVLAGRQALGPDLVRLALDAGDDRRAGEVTVELAEGASLAGTDAFRAFADIAAAWQDVDADAAVGAAELMLTTGRRPTAAAMFGDAARLLRRAARVAEADACATRAVGLFELCGADADAAMLRQTIVGKAPRAQDRPRFGWAALTPTEQRVVDLIAEGLANRDIAGVMFVSKRTVETHVSAAYRKLEVNSRVELARLVLERR